MLLSRSFERIFASVIVCTVLIFIFPMQNVSAETQKLTAVRYELDKDVSFSVGGGERLSDKDDFVYGGHSLGSLSINGKATAEGRYNDFYAYAATGDLTLRYAPSLSDYKTSNEKNWTLIDSDAEKISGVDLGGDIDMGAILVQRSSDGNSWDEYKPVSKTDVFDDNKSELTNFYTIKVSDIKKGMYYRVSVAYEMKKKTGSKKVETLFGDWEYKDVFTIKRFIEVYKFYVGYGADPVSFRDIDGEVSDDPASFRNGFSISKGGTSFETTVSINGGRTKSVNNNDVFTEPGKYEFKVKSELGKEYTHTITITEGLTQKSLKPKVYENGNKDGYSGEGKANSGMASYGKNSLSSVIIAQDAEKNLVTSKVKGVDAYGINGSKLCSFYMRVDNPGGNYEIADDDYGKDKDEKVMEAKVGKVGKGVLLIQKSSDNVNWKKIDSDYYADGLHTSDYSEHYAGNGYYKIYSPNGAEMQKGLYLRITYAYNVKRKGSKENNRCVEVYNIYLCSNNLDAVTFHNLTLENQTSSIKDDENKNGKTIADYELHKGAETLLSGSSTVTGFEIDTKMNPTVSISVKRDGKEISVPQDKRFKETGKYTVTLTSKVGSKRELTLYVDRRSSEEILQGYFGEGFIRGKRIYDESKSVPVFECGHSFYCINKTDTRFRAIKGNLKSLDSRNSIFISQSNAEKIKAISEPDFKPGYYKGVFTTRPDDEEYPGDYLTITFQFCMIEEGTAPGPQKNQQVLEQYSSQNISDFYPMYYGVTEKVNNVDVTVAFADRKAAVDFAVKLEKQKVEELPDGTYQYEDAEKNVQKVNYRDNKSLMEALNEFAEKRIQPYYFDLTKTYKFQTIEKKEIETIDDLRKLGYNKSFIVAGKGERENLSKKGRYEKTLISPKPYYYLQKQGNTTVSGCHDFQFVKDKHGYDSDSFYITDCEGNKYHIGYGEDVGKALQEQGCKSGTVTIHETTCYKDSVEYEATFIAKDDNTAELEFTYSKEGSEESLTFKQDESHDIQADYFKLDSLTDSLDPYSIVRVTNKEVSGEKPFYAVTDQLDANNPPIFAAKGEYEVAVINRLGYSYSFNVSVSGNAEVILDFQGEGENISTVYGAKNVQLPKLTKTGYTLTGFEDENGKIITNEIAEILYKGNTVLKAVWEAKQYQLTLLNADGSQYKTMIVAFDAENQLPIPDAEEGKEFVCWMNNGTPVESNVFTLTTESDITLTATFKDKEVTSNKRFIPIIGAVLAVGVIIAVIVIKKRGGKRHEK